MVRAGYSGDTHGLLWDGSSARHQAHAQPAARACRRELQPPGGATSFVMMDGSETTSGGFDAATEMPGRRHTNGLKRVTPFDTANDQPQRRQVAVQHHQPPGGSSSFALTDGSDAAAAAAASRARARAAPPPPQDDALSAFVDSFGKAAAPPRAPFQPIVENAPPPRFQPAAAKDAGSMAGINVLAPPGGFSSFSVGWGDDSAVNHHHHYASRAAAGRQPAGGHLASAMPAVPSHPSPCGSRWQRSAVPPGGASSIQFG